MIAIEKNNIKKYLKGIPTDLGRVIQINETDEGIASHVFRIETEKGVYYLKQTRDIWKNNPQMKVHPDSAKYEYECLKRIEKIHLLKLEQSYVPHGHFLDEENKSFIMSDIQGKGKLLSKEFQSRVIDPNAAFNIGKLIGVLHGTTFSSINSIRPNDGDNIIEEDNYVLRCQSVCDNIPIEAAREIMRRDSKVQKTFIYGNVCPKNTYADSDGTVRMFDFDIARIGDPAMDIAYPLGHYLIMLFVDDNLKDNIKNSVNRLIEGYRREMLNCNIDSADFDKIINNSIKYIAATLLYRVDGVSKALYLTDNQKQAVRYFASQLALGKIRIINL